MSKIKFKNSGKSLKDFKKSKKYNDLILSKLKKPIGIDFPLKDKSSTRETLFKMTYNINDQVKVNLKNLILTKKGEYLCLPNFGTNLISLYNRTDVEDLGNTAMSDIQEAVSVYMPYVNLKNFSSKKVSNTLDNTSYHEINIQYDVNEIEEENDITIKLLMSR